MNSLQKTFCRPGVSKLHGVGMYAVCPIPKGTVVMPTRGLAGCWKPKEWAHENNIQNGVVNMMQELICSHEYDSDTFVFVPQEPIIDFNAQMLMNHSNDANLTVNDNYHLEAVRDIEEGEELTENYLCVCGEQYFISKVKNNR